MKMRSIINVLFILLLSFSIDAFNKKHHLKNLKRKSTSHSYRGNSVQFNKDSTWYDGYQFDPRDESYYIKCGQLTNHVNNYTKFNQSLHIYTVSVFSNTLNYIDSLITELGGGSSASGTTVLYNDIKAHSDIANGLDTSVEFQDALSYIQNYQSGTVSDHKNISKILENLGSLSGIYSYFIKNIALLTSNMENKLKYLKSKAFDSEICFDGTGIKELVCDYRVEGGNCTNGPFNLVENGKYLCKDPHSSIGRFKFICTDPTASNTLITTESYQATYTLYNLCLKCDDKFLTVTDGTDFVAGDACYRLEKSDTLEKNQIKWEIRDMMDLYAQKDPYNENLVQTDDIIHGSLTPSFSE